LTATRKKLTYQSGRWTSDTLLSGGPNLALLGLTCNDIYAMETMDFIYIMEQYNRARKTLNKVRNCYLKCYLRFVAAEVKAYVY
jgi:hypothetical protein